MSKQNTCVSICLTHQGIELALEKLRTQGIDMQQVSIVGKGFHNEEHPIGFYTVGNDICYKGLQGNFWGNLWKLLTGAAFFWVPGFGSLTAAGPIVGLLVRSRENLVINGGFGVLGAALFDMGVPRNNIIDYEQAIRAERFLLIVNDGWHHVERASDILHNETQQVTVHCA